MASEPSLSALPQWPAFAGIANASMSSLSRISGAMQWLLAEPSEPHQARVLLCSGEGPLETGSQLPRPVSPVQPLGNGTLISLPLGNDREPKGYLGIWHIDMEGSQDAFFPLLEAKAGLFSALLDELQRSRALLAELERARLDAETDVLTGLLNRRGWNRQLAREEARCQRYGHICTLLVVDLDDLKTVNDDSGHCAGDRLIRHIGRLLADTVRQPDIVARIGGDEFAILLVNTDALNARGFEKRLAQAFAESGIQASTGRASWQPGEALQDTLCRAGRAMYANKPVHRTSQA
ncbi:GGDEF domain-containing protein [Alcanivorax sp. 1008]|uniref:GGDEF domain-containing protein n=1 Tax=Alcanivorax sp. 1008 TaxID=2816853 RepID=UPI001DD0D39C|nr:GGDEF domain-containing protein [Alcanivorax sp. 1008]MCC1495469.1 GGDEF domain-containing protein [Alcanivorax sp. 1008]